LTIVAFGTSVPELSVGITAALGGHSEIVLGNIVGSNIANIFLILGVAALLRPIKIAKRTVKREAMIMLAVVLIVPILSIDGRLTLFDGIILVVLFVAYLVYFLYDGLKNDRSKEEGAPPPFTVNRSSLMAGVGIGGVVLGAFWIVEGAVFIAEKVGISQAIIGLTLVAFGTSIPELGATIVAARHDESDITLGNIVGSNIFNVLLILGVALLLVPIDVTDVIIPSMIIMVGAAAVLIPMMWSNFQLSRREGVILLSFYGAYLVFLFI